MPCLCPEQGPPCANRQFRRLPPCIGGRSILTFVGTVLIATPIATFISIGVLLVVFVATRSFAWASRVGMIVLPFVQLVVEGPFRTAATGVLMTFIGLRFAMAAVEDRRRATIQA